MLASIRYGTMCCLFLKCGLLVVPRNLLCLFLLLLCSNLLGRRTRRMLCGLCLGERGFPNRKMFLLLINRLGLLRLFSLFRFFGFLVDKNLFCINLVRIFGILII